MLQCKICGYQTKQLHQHIKAIHNISTKEYRNIYDPNAMMQIGWSKPNDKQPINSKASDIVKSGYIGITNKLKTLPIYPKNELKLLLLENECWKKYLGKTKYRTMINDDPIMYKSIMLYTSKIPVKWSLEEKMRFIIEYNYNLDLLKCICGKRITFNKYCRHCPDPRKSTCKSHVPETIQKIRKATIKYLTEQVTGQLAPRYNVNSISIIEEYGRDNGYNFQHAENGGEYYISELGYWVDGYDKENNVVIEIDEPHHFDRDGNLTPRDIRRQVEIENLLNCKFIRIKYEK